ncbi:MAG: hypothetical protein F6K47_09100 [Symploca sp. SIO2E6]|nr:hypothetical protein [Symploca sp. SIO2E6]
MLIYNVQLGIKAISLAGVVCDRLLLVLGIGWTNREMLAGRVLSPISG